MTSRVTMTTNGKTTTHDISMTGVAGALFWSAIIGAVIFIIGFATESWHTYGSSKQGLWQSCSCSSLFLHDNRSLQAVQAMESLGLIGIIMTLLLSVFYNFVHQLNKNVVLVLLVASSYITAAFIVIGVIVFSLDTFGDNGDFGYSFAFAIIGGIFLFIAAICSSAQLLQTGLCE